LGKKRQRHHRGTYSAIIPMAARDLKYKLDPEYAARYQSGTVGSPASKALS